MRTIKIKLNQYFRDQFLDNPQLFETNLLEEFPDCENYRVVIKKDAKFNFMLLTVVFHDHEGDMNYERSRLGSVV